jgi:hypothetical protein
MTTSRSRSVAKDVAAFASSLSTLVLGPTGAAPASILVQFRGERVVRVAPVPILVYHVIGDPRPGAPYPDLFVSTCDFIAQVRWLERRGYRAVTLRAVGEHWHRGAPLPPNPIVISFDDGYRGVAQHALAVMRERGWPGLLNLTVKSLQVAGGLSERQVRLRAPGGNSPHTRLRIRVFRLSTTARSPARSQGPAASCAAGSTCPSTSSAIRPVDSTLVLSLPCGAPGTSVRRRRSRNWRRRLAPTSCAASGSAAVTGSQASPPA